MCFCCCRGAIGNVGPAGSCVVGSAKETTIFGEDCLGGVHNTVTIISILMLCIMAINSELCLPCLYIS